MSHMPMPQIPIMQTAASAIPDNSMGKGYPQAGIGPPIRHASTRLSSP
jgi:hypothetical protein